MRRYFLFGLIYIIMVGCYKANANHTRQTDLVGDFRITTVEYSGCEYVVVQSYNQKRLAITHKGNCKHCIKRRNIK